MSDPNANQPPLKPWRRQQRAALIERRMAIPRAQRKAWNAAIEERLYARIVACGECVIGLYWPFRGEFNSRSLMRNLVEQGLSVVLPVVVERNAPLEFRAWRPGTAMTHGVYNIPVPQSGDALKPDAVVAPLVGFDRAGYRLGNGGGYYDRTLAALEPTPFIVGVGYEFCRIDSIRPQWHDVAMHAIVTEAGVTEHAGPDRHGDSACQPAAQFSDDAHHAATTATTPRSCS